MTAVAENYAATASILPAADVAREDIQRPVLMTLAPSVLQVPGMGIIQSPRATTTEPTS